MTDSTEGPTPEVGTPIQKLGAYLTNLLDEDKWLTAEGYLNEALAQLAAERARADAARALLVEIYHLLLTGDVKFVENLGGGCWTFPDRAKAVIFGKS